MIVQQCGVAMRSEQTPHAPEVVASCRRLSAGGTRVVDSGDTQANPDTLVPLADGADLLIHECYSAEGLAQHSAAAPPADRAALRARLQQGFASTHTEVAEAAAIARDAGVRRLVLTHIHSWEDQALLHAKATGIFAGDVVVARDGLVLDL